MTTLTRLRVEFVVFDEFEVVLFTKEIQEIPGYMPNKVTNTTESFDYIFKCIFIAKIDRQHVARSHAWS